MNEIIYDAGGKYLAVIFGSVVIAYLWARVARKFQYSGLAKFATVAAIAVISFGFMYWITPYEFSDEAIKEENAGPLTELLRQTALGGYNKEPIRSIAQTLSKYATGLGALIWLPTFLWLSRWKKTDDGVLL